MIEIDDKQMRQQLMKILRALKTLKDSKSVYRKATRAAAKIALPAIKAAAPVATGALRKSIKVKAMPRSRVYIGCSVRIGDSKHLGQGKSFYAGFHELGHHLRNGKKVEGTRAMTNAFNSKRSAALAAAIETARVETDKILSKAK